MITELGFLKSDSSSLLIKTSNQNNISLIQKL